MNRPKAPSDRMLKAIALKTVNPDLTYKEAAIKAGYSPVTAHNATKNIFNKPIAKTFVDSYRYALAQSGIDQKRLANKLNDLLDAEDIIKDNNGNIIASTPNKKLQLDTVKVIHDVYGVKTSEKQNEGVKRRITLEEFEEKEGIE